MSRSEIRVGVEDAHRLAQDEGATILDVVDSVVYDKVAQRIERALRIAPEEVPERYQDLPQGKVVLAYCT